MSHSLGVTEEIRTESSMFSKKEGEGESLCYQNFHFWEKLSHKRNNTTISITST